MMVMSVIVVVFRGRMVRAGRSSVLCITSVVGAIVAAEHTNEPRRFELQNLLFFHSRSLLFLLLLRAVAHHVSHRILTSRHSFRVRALSFRFVHHSFGVGAIRSGHIPHWILTCFALRIDAIRSGSSLRKQGG